MTLFIEVNTFDLQYISQTLLHDYKLSDNETNTPDIHWSVVIRQNGNLYSQETVEIKNQPFTIEVLLPRLAITPSSAMINIVEKEKMNFDFSENFDLSQNYSPSIGMVSNQPFCYGYGGPRRDRSLVSSNWEFAVIGMVDCAEFFSSDVHLDEANILYETDILYISIPRSDFYPLSEDDKIPLSNFKNQNFILTTFVDFNKNDIIETGEIKTIELHISE